MSGQGSFPPSEEPLEAELVEPAPLPAKSGKPQGSAAPPLAPFERPRRSRWPVIGCAGVLLVTLVAMCGGSIYMIYSSARQLAAAKPAGAEKSRPLVDEQAEVAKTLDGIWRVKATDAKYRDVRRLLGNLEHVQRNETPDGFSRLVDWAAFSERFYREYRHPAGYVQRMELDEVQRDQFEMPLEASRFEIAVVDERSPDDWYVYTYAREGTLKGVPYLFEVRRTSGTWKLVDWAEVPELLWSAERMGATCGSAGVDSQRDEQEQLIKDLEAADEHFTAGKRAEGEARLRQAENRNCPARIQPSNMHLIALRWHRQGNPGQAERVLQRIGSFDRYPWAHHLLAEIRYGQSRFSEALAALDSYEKCAGFYYDIAQMKAHCQHQLKQPGAAETALAMLRFSPDDNGALGVAMEYVPIDRLGEVFKLLPAEEKSAERLTMLARNLLYRNEIENYQRIRDYVAQQDAESDRVLELDARLCHYQGDLDRAIELQKQLVERVDDEQQDNARQELLSLQMNVKTAVEIYREADRPRETLEGMTSGIAYEEAMIDADDLKAILPLHAERDPQDPRLPWYAVQLARQEQDWPAVVTKVKEALQSLPEDEDRESWDAELEEQLLEARCELGEALDVYREAEDKAQTYQSLARLLEGRNDWEMLKQLNALHSDPSDLWRRYYALRIEEADAREAHRSLADVLRKYEQLQQENAASKKIHEWYLTSRITALHIEGPGWREYFQSHADPASLLNRLAERFRREKDAAALQELMILARHKLPDHDFVFQLELKTLWDQRDYAGIISRCEMRPKATGAGTYGRTRHDYWLASCLMLGETQKAWELATAEGGDIREQWLVRLAQGNTEELRAILKDHRQELYSPLSFGLCADASAIRKYVASDEFRQVRNEFALRMEESYSDLHVVLLYREAPAWTKERLLDRLRELKLTEVAVEELPQPPLMQKTFRLRWRDNECILACGDKPYVQAKELRGYGNLPVELKSAVETHQGWVTIEQESGTGAHDDAVWTKLVSSLAKETIALWAWLPQGQVVRAPMTPEIAEKLRTNTGALAALAQPMGAVAWMLPSSADLQSESADGLGWYARSRAALASGKLGRVRVRISWGNAVEEHWLDVAAIHDEHWGNFSLDGKLTQDSALYPNFRAGDVVRINRYDVEAWEE